MGALRIVAGVDIGSAAGKKEAIAGEHPLQDQVKGVFPSAGRAQRHEDDLASSGGNGLDAGSIGCLHAKEAFCCGGRPSGHQNGWPAHRWPDLPWRPPRRRPPAKRCL